jgi:PUA domain protein
MLRRFEEIAGSTKMKKSAIKGTRNAFLQLYPAAEPIIDNVVSGRSNVNQVKLRAPASNITFYTADGKLVFFAEKNGPILPFLKIVHAYPFITKSVTVDPRAIRHIMGGANVMAPGLTNEEARMDDVVAGDIVAVYGWGKQCAIAIG